MNYNNNVLNILENSLITFKKIDEIFIFLPKDINRHIYSFITPICKDCEYCCNICRINCYYVSNCNRGNVCCVSELNMLTKQFDKKKKKNEDSIKNYSSDDLDIKTDDYL